MAILFQIIGTILLCFSCTNMGIMMAWPSSTILLFKSENTTLHRPMGDGEISLFGSLLTIGPLIANPIAGLVLDNVGRKKTAILTSLIFVIAWLIIALTSRVEVVLTAMFIGGLGFAIFLQIPIYISEICQDSIRGTMTSGPMLFYELGLLASYFLGGCLPYRQMTYTCLSLSVIGVIFVCLLKESPMSLMAKDREEDAAKSIAFYRSQKSISKEVVHEMDKLRRIFNSNTEGRCTVFDKWRSHIGANTEDQENLVLAIFQKFSINSAGIPHNIDEAAFIFQGLPVVLVYAEPLFAETVPADVISPNLCSVLMGVVMIVCGSVAAYLTDVFGRRPLLIYSSIVAGICCMVLGTQILTEWGPKWMIPMFIYMFTAFYTFGAGTVPVVVLSEIFLPEVKSIMSMLAVQWAWILNFVILLVFNLLVAVVGLPPVFYFFSFVCLSTALFFFYFLPETKGLPVYAIQDLFTKNK